MDLDTFLKVYNDIQTYPNNEAVAKALGVHPRTVRKWVQKARQHDAKLIDRAAYWVAVSKGQEVDLGEGSEPIETDQERREEAVRLAKSLQKARDQNRVKNKTFREYARIENAVEEYVSSLDSLLKQNSFNILTHKHEGGQQKAVGIVHFSDIHFNERIDLPHNKYNFDIASRRIRKHVNRAKHYFGGLGITEVVVAFTSDLLNSSRRLDELLVNATNRAKATFLAVDILQQAICDLNTTFNVTVVSVTGNESRIEKDVGWVKPLAQDNFDFMIHNMLAYLFKDKPGVTFVDCEEHPLECVINVAGSNVLMIHGHNGIAKDPTKKVAQKRAQYIAQGIQIDYVIMGHIHEAHIADTFARSSGLPGANAYSENALNLTSRASQNLYIFYDDKSHDCIKVDLQNVEDHPGYDFDKALEAYNTRSHLKGKEGKVVFQVVV